MCLLDSNNLDGPQSMEEALVNHNMHFKGFGSFGVMVQPERNMNHDAYIR